MKAIIYAGIGLFSVATVYGVVDYYNTSKKGTLDKLYKEPEEVVVTEAPPVVTNVLPVNLNETRAVNPVAVAKVSRKSKHQKRTIRLDEFSRGRIEERMISEPVKAIEPVKDETKTPELAPATEIKVETVAQPAVIRKEGPRRISLSDFSRAPLRNPVRTEIKKIAIGKKN